MDKVPVTPDVCKYRKWDSINWVCGKDGESFDVICIGDDGSAFPSECPYCDAPMLTCFVGLNKSGRY